MWEFILSNAPIFFFSLTNLCVLSYFLEKLWMVSANQSSLAFVRKKCLRKWFFVLIWAFQFFFYLRIGISCYLCYPEVNIPLHSHSCILPLMLLSCCVDEEVGLYWLFMCIDFSWWWHGTYESCHKNDNDIIFFPYLSITRHLLIQQVSNWSVVFCFKGTEIHALETSWIRELRPVFHSIAHNHEMT